jgi:hypothetical protein
MNVRLALLLAALPAIAPAAVQVSDAECPVRIVLAAQSFHSSAEAGARLASDTVNEIHLPSWLPRGLRIESVSAGGLSDPAAGPTASDSKADAISPLASRPFNIEHPDLLAIQWEDVGVPKARGSGFTVPAGTYRMKLVFAVVAPREQRGPLVHLCTVYSSAFVLEAESGWTTFR